MSARYVKLCQSDIDKLAAAICACTPQIDFGPIESLLSQLLSEAQAINSNTDEIEGLIKDVVIKIDEGNIKLADILTTLEKILVEAQAINANTDDLESLIGALTDEVKAEFDETQDLLQTIIDAQRFPVALEPTCYKLDDGTFAELTPVSIYNPVADAFATRLLDSGGVEVTGAAIASPCDCDCVDCP